MAAAVTCVLAVAVRVALAALTYAGPVTVTAHMGAFSPNPVEVKVNSSATSSLSSGYTPPSGVPEGDLSAKYDWTVAQVQYKATVNDPTTGKLLAYGSPPSGSYVSPILISPSQPSTSSGATLTFTPLTAGYWQITVSCSVTVTDTKTNQYWSGSANAGPEDLTSYTLDITYTGPVVGGFDNGTVVTNNKIPIEVHAGWPIQLGVTHVAPTDLPKTFTWSIDGAGGNGAAAIGGYNPTTGPTYVTTLNPASSTSTTFPGAKEYYYYTTAGSQTASVTPTGSGIPPAKTTFSVAKPTEVISTVTSEVHVWSAFGGFGFGQWMFNPPFGNKTGILLTANPGKITGFSGDFNWVQVYAPDQSYWDASGNLLDTVGGAGLDTKFPYGPDGPLGDVPFKTDDSPSTGPNPIGMSNGPAAKIVVADHATMWLIYKPSATGSIWVPVASAAWNWGGTDTLVGGSWALTNGSWAQSPAGPPTNTYPQWAGLASKTFTKGP